MNETCDRCGPAVLAVYRVERDGELYLCRHCANRDLADRELATEPKEGIPVMLSWQTQA